MKILLALAVGAVLAGGQAHTAPKAPKSPVFGGMNGCRFAFFTKAAPPAINTTSTTDLITTSQVFARADSLIPLISNALTAMIIRKMRGMTWNSSVTRMMTLSIVPPK